MTEAEANFETRMSQLRSGTFESTIPDEILAQKIFVLIGPGKAASLLGQHSPDLLYQYCREGSVMTPHHKAKAALVVTMTDYIASQRNESTSHSYSLIEGGLFLKTTERQLRGATPLEIVTILDYADQPQREEVITALQDTTHIFLSQLLSGEISVEWGKLGENIVMSE